MKADISRNTFDARNHYLRVLMQQGRALLDADWNEQTAILLHFMRNLTQDLIGKHGGPADNAGFEIILNPDAELSQAVIDKLTQDGLLPLKEKDFLIGPGHYYVEGMLCELDEYVLYSEQAVAGSASLATDTGPFLVYLDVWERLITPNEDIDIRELALGGPDTANRSKLESQVRIHKLNGDDLNVCNDYEKFRSVISKVIKPGTGKMAAQIRMPDSGATDEACVISPKSEYRGAENQLYRVEIHIVEKGEDAGNYFKWSRENGAVTFPIKSISTIIKEEDEQDALEANGPPEPDMQIVVTVEHLGRDERFGLQVGNWVEIVDKTSVLACQPNPLMKVVRIDPVDKLVYLEQDDANSKKFGSSLIQPILRRWDSPGLVGVELSVGESEKWLPLEDGVEVKFEGSDSTFQTGDYWLIPARTETGNVIWPQHEVTNPKTQKNDLEPDFVAPHGEMHYYAPLALFDSFPDNSPVDLRNTFEPLTRNHLPGLQVNFNFDPSEPKVEENVTFTASVSTFSGENITMYCWDWDDGKIDSDNASTTKMHTFGSAKTYNVKLRVTTSFNRVAEVTKAVVVSEATSGEAPSGLGKAAGKKSVVAKTTAATKPIKAAAKTTTTKKATNKGKTKS